MQPAIAVSYVVSSTGGFHAHKVIHLCSETCHQANEVESLDSIVPIELHASSSFGFTWQAGASLHRLKWRRWRAQGGAGVAAGAAGAGVAERAADEGAGVTAGVGATHLRKTWKIQTRMGEAMWSNSQTCNR